MSGSGAREPVPQRRAATSKGHHRDITYPTLPEPLDVACYDNHTHLQIIDGREGEQLDVDEHLRRAAAVGIAGAITVGDDVETSRWQVQAARGHGRLLAAVAIHPFEAEKITGNLDRAIATIAELAADPVVAAIGETGLDYHWSDDADALERQRESFRAHIALAKRLELPMQIHDRDAHDDVIRILREEGAPECTVFHCFSGDAAMARVCADEGWYLSFAGTVTFKNAEPLREALRVAPLDRVLVETDAPFLTPAPYRGRPNAPYLVPLTVRSMAATLGLDARELAARIAATTLSVYGPFGHADRARWIAEGRPTIA